MKDLHKAFRLIQRGHAKFDVLATAAMGEMILEGWGTRQNIPEGIMYLTSAAKDGSNVAAGRLGMALANGNYGLNPEAGI